MQSIIRFARLLFGWTFALLVICFKIPEISEFSSSLIGWLVAAFVVAALYSLPPRLLYENTFIKKLAFCLFFGTVVGFVFLSLVIISQLGTGPLLVMGTIDFGSSRAWGIVFAILMGLGAIAGVVDLFLYGASRSFETK